MAANRDEPHASPRTGADDNTVARALTGLTEALSELSRLTLDPFSEVVAGVLADLDNVPAESDVGVDTVRKLLHCSTEHQRVAIELEAAARYCRLVEQEIKQRVDGLLAGRKENALPAITRSSISQSGWLSKILRRGSPAPRFGEKRVPAIGEHRPAPGVLSAAPRHPEPRVLMPWADVATLALGPLEVYVAGQRVQRWNSLKARAVFQYLLIHQDGPTRRDVLMALQWPEHSRNSARNNLNVALYSLRNTLDGLGRNAQPILYRDGCYILNPELTSWVDRSEFLSAIDNARLARRANRPRQVIDAYHKAIQLYRGPLFDDDVTGEWYLPEQRRLAELYLQALEHVAEIHFELGELPEAVRFGQLAISNDPCCEPIHRMLMRCYASQHQQQLVSRQYRICVAVLHDELGIPPSEETVQLYRQLT
jgi:DNA-binding SARP family transcriptional activator